MNELHKTLTAAGPAEFPEFPRLVSILALLTELSAADCRVVEFHAARIAAEKELQAQNAEDSIDAKQGEVERRRLGTWTYVLQLVCCGKGRCRLCRGVAYRHGPYWYAYRKNHGKLQSKYVGSVFYPVTAEGTVLKS